MRTRKDNEDRVAQRLRYNFDHLTKFTEAGLKDGFLYLNGDHALVGYCAETQSVKPVKCSADAGLRGKVIQIVDRTHPLHDKMCLVLTVSYLTDILKVEPISKGHEPLYILLDQIAVL